MIFLFILALIPNLFVTFLATDLAGNIVKQLAYLFFSCIILFLPALLLKSKPHFLLLSFFLLLGPIEISHIILNRMPVTEGYMAAILQTNMTEALELFSFMKVYLLIAFLLLVFYYWIVFTRIKNRPLLTVKGKIVIGIVFLFFNICLWAVMWKLSGYEVDNVSRFKETNSNFRSKYFKTYPLDMIKAASDVFISRKEVRDMEAQLKDFSFGINRESKYSGREIYILVIGESARYGNFSINGYHRPTSPLLEQQNNLVTYSDVLSTANLTNTAMQLMLTRATPLEPEVAYKEKAVTDAFKEAEFQVAWIANQSVSNRFIQRITASADYTFFSTTDYDSSTSFDGKLLDPLDEVLKQKNDKQFIVIHTLGSHFRYNSRYPDSFRLFNPALQDNTTYSVTPEKKELLVNSYDNSIYYTDYLLHQIISRLEEENVVGTMIYLSDHGENLYDDDTRMAVHGNAEPPLVELHIPLFVWTSGQYKEVWPHKVEAVIANKDKAVSSSNLFQTLLDMADLSYPGERKSLSILSDDFRADSIRYVLTPGKEILEFKSLNNK